MTFKRLFVVSIVAALVTLVYSMRFEIVSQGFGVWIKDALAMSFDNTGYPIELDSVPLQLLGVGNRVAVVSSGNFSMYNSAGNLVLNERIASRTPVALSSGQKILLYSQGEKDLSVRSGSMSLYERVTDHPIYTADIANNGVVAYSTAAVVYQSHLTVLDTRYRTIFEWAGTKGILNALSLDEEGKRLACGSVALYNGSVGSKLLYFDVAKGQQVFEYDLEKEMILSLGIQANGNILAVTDSSILLFSPAGKKLGEFRFDAEQLVAVDYTSDGGVVAVVGDYALRHNLKLVCLDAALNIQRQTEVNSEVKAVREYKQGVILFTYDWAIHYDENLEPKRRIETADASQAEVAGEFIYFTTLKKLNRISIE